MLDELPEVNLDKELGTREESPLSAEEDPRVFELSITELGCVKLADPIKLDATEFEDVPGLASGVFTTTSTS